MEGGCSNRRNFPSKACYFQGIRLWRSVTRLSPRPRPATVEPIERSRPSPSGVCVMFFRARSLECGTACFASSARRPRMRLFRSTSCARAPFGAYILVTHIRRGRRKDQARPLFLPVAGLSSTRSGARSHGRPGDQRQPLISSFSGIADFGRPILCCPVADRQSGTPRNVLLGSPVTERFYQYYYYNYRIYSLGAPLPTFIACIIHNINENKLKSLLLYTYLPYLNSHIPFSLAEVVAGDHRFLEPVATVKCIAVTYKFIHTVTIKIDSRFF